MPIGVVVERLDDLAVFDATGTMPRNVNFGTPAARLLDFLWEDRVSLPAAGEAEFDMDEGLPPGIGDAS